MNFVKYVAAVGMALTLVACGGGGGSGGTPIGTPAAIAPVTPASSVVAANSSVSTISIQPSSTTLNADGTSTVTLTIYALTSGNASVAGASIEVAATNGVILSVPSVVTGSAGVTLTMRANETDQSNRVSVISASCTNCLATPATTQVSVVGASISLTNSGSTSLSIGGAPATLSATVKNFAGVGLPGVDVSFASTDPLVLGVSGAFAKTNSSGVAQVVVTGLSTGNASVDVSALGNARSQAYTSSSSASVLTITSPVNNSVFNTSQTANISVTAPAGASQLTFATTLGSFGNGQTSQTVSVVGGLATANLAFTQAGTATVTVIDDLKNSANLKLFISPATANKVLLNASQTSLPISVANGVQSSVTLTARAISYNGLTDQGVANVPIQFSMTGGPGAGEFISPALQYTDNTGSATATFTAGTTASISNGIRVKAAVLGTAVQTGTAPSNNDVLLTVGGQALSVAFGPSSVIAESTDKTLYLHAYSVLVTDANNNPVANQVVTLRMRPVAFSLGSACIPSVTYCSEDVNGNGSLDAGEDGSRIVTTDATAGSCPAVAAAGGSLDTSLTPSNSDAGSVPSVVTTDANGVAAFNLTYLKGSAIWLVNKLTATVSSNGTETSNSTIFRLAPSENDFIPGFNTINPDGSVTTTAAICYLPASRYSF